MGCSFSVVGGEQARHRIRENEATVVRTLAFMVVRQVLALVGFGSSADTKDVETAVLRHQLARASNAGFEIPRTGGDRNLWVDGVKGAISASRR
jgi:hypothetical protein